RPRGTSGPPRPREIGSLAEVEQHAAGVPWTHERRGAAVAVAPFEDAHARRVELGDEPRERVDVDREVMEARTPAREEAIGGAPGPRGLDEHRLPVADPEADGFVQAVLRTPSRPHGVDAEEAAEPGERVVDRADGEPQVADAEADAVLRRDRLRRVVVRSRAVEPGHLPELDEDARGRPRGDECGRVAVPVVAAVDDPEPRAFEIRRVAGERVLLDVEREVMEPGTSARDEPLDEAH